MAKTELDVIWLNQLSNLRLICKNCNQEKSDHVEFFPYNLDYIDFILEGFALTCKNSTYEIPQTR